MEQRFDWGEERVALLKQLCAEHCSYGEISRRMGITRNAAIGKAKRLGIDNGVAPHARPLPRVVLISRRMPRLRSAPLPASERPDLFLAPNGQPYTALTIPYLGHCKFPYDKPDVEGGYIFCGHPVRKEGESYCAFHASRCFVKAHVPEKRDRKGSRYFDFSRAA